MSPLSLSVYLFLSALGGAAIAPPSSLMDRDGRSDYPSGETVAEWIHSKNGSVVENPESFKEK